MSLERRDHQEDRPGPLTIGAKMITLPLDRTPLGPRQPLFAVPALSQNDGKGGLSLRGVAVATETATTAENRQNRQNRHGRPWALYLQGKQKEGKVLPRTAKTVKTAKNVMKATPLKLNPPFPSSWLSREKKKPININNFAGLSRKWVGVKLFMCFPFSWGKKGKHHKQNSQEILGKGRESLGQSQDNPGTVP